MGQKINPFSLRLGIIKGWRSRWFAKKNLFKDQLEEDFLIRRIIDKKIAPAGIVRIEIERGPHNVYRIIIKAARPGLIIGRGGKGIEELSKAIESKLKNIFVKRGVQKPTASLSLNVEELKRNEASAQYIAQMIAWDLERRLPARRTIKKHLESALENREVKGVKIKLSGRIDGNEIARREWVAKGKLPLQTLRADIDYGEATAFNAYGTVGVKVWLYKGEVFE
jgi:small subunit ribosomal protein S3